MPENLNTSTEVASSTTSEATPQKVSNAKPYDDDMLEVYEKISADEGDGSDDNDKQTGVGDVKTSDEATVKTDEKTPEDAETKVAGEEGDPAVELETQKITKEINGKQVEFTVADAIKSHMERETNNRELNRRFTLAAKKEKDFQDNVTKLKSNMNNVITEARKGGIVRGIRALAKMAAGESGVDIVEFEKKYFGELDEVHKVITKFTPEQRDAYWAKRDADEARLTAKQLTDKENNRLSIEELQNNVSTLRKQNAMEEPEFWGAYEFLTKEAVGEGKKYQSKEHIQAEDVVRHALLVRHENKVIEAGSRLGIDNDEVLDRISNITIANPSLTVDDIEEIIKTSGIAKKASPEAVENLNRKAGKSNTRFNQVNSAKKVNKVPEGYDKESLDFLYRNQPKAITRIVR